MKVPVGDLALDAQRVFCIGRNYAAHAVELGNEVPDSPVVFMKPASALIGPDATIVMPTHGAELHHEAEIVVLIGRQGRPTSADAHTYIAGLALGLDLTLRDVQRQLKSRGLPWEVAKAFDGAAPLGPVVPFQGQTLSHLEFDCRVNDIPRQHGDSALMLFPIERLLTYLGSVWMLRPGDLIYTGTPKGVGPLQVGDTIEVTAPWCPAARWLVQP